MAAPGSRKFAITRITAMGVQIRFGKTCVYLVEEIQLT